MLARCVCWDIGLFSNKGSLTKCDLSQLDNDELACHLLPIDPYLGSD